MCDNVVNTCSSTITFVLKSVMTQKMCDKAVNRCFFVFNSISDQYKTQEMCITVVSECASLIAYCPDKYKNVWWSCWCCLAALKLVPDWFVTSKNIEKIFTATYTDENILYFNEGPGDAIFNSNGRVILNIDLNNINLDNNFDEDDNDTIILIRLLAWHIKFEKRKELEKELSEELMPLAWHPNRWWDWCMSKDEKK